MSFTQQTATEKAKKDLAKRLKVEPSKVEVSAVSDVEFPNGSLGSPTSGEMSMQMISSGWKITLKVDGSNFEYRADKYQLRLHSFNGKNYLIESF
jgi:hypothetical protein